MYIYVVSTNVGTHEHPSFNNPRLVYFGQSVKKAEDVIGDFANYQQPEDRFPNRPLEYSGLPQTTEREMIQFYLSGGFWYSIERINIPVAIVGVRSPV